METLHCYSVFSISHNFISLFFARIDESQMEKDEFQFIHFLELANEVLLSLPCQQNLE
jgi:hypothetical protein